MVVRIGIALGANCASAAVTFGRWPLATVELAASEVTGDALSDCNALLPRIKTPTWIRPRSVTIALDNRNIQVRTIRGLPPVSNVRLLERTIAQTPTRYFLRRSSQLRSSSIRLIEPGCVEAAAVEQYLLDQLDTACRNAGRSLTAVLPLSRALERLTPAERMQEHTGAVGAAMYPPSGALTIRMKALRQRAARTHPKYGKGVLIPAGCVTLGLAAVMMAPSIHAYRESSTARREIAAAARARYDAVIAERSLSDVTDRLRDLGEYASSRRSITMLLGDLSRAIPEKGAMTAFRVDSSSVTVVVLAPKSGDVLTGLEKISYIVAPEVTGPVTREIVGGRELERLTVRFRIADGAINGSVPVETLFEGGDE
jgi:hypothetical protein